MNHRVLFDRILAKKERVKKMSVGGIALPDSAVEKPRLGRVMAVGDGRMLEDGSRAKMSIALGDEVIIAPNAGIAVDRDDDSLVVMSEQEVIAVIG
jgi:chaperonin GroES